MRLRRWLAVGLLCLGLGSAGVAGCARGADGDDGIATAGGTPTPSASGGTTNPEQERERFLAYAQCMRDNGVPDFPDPVFEEGGGIGLALPGGTDRAKVDAAAEKCKEHLPHGGEAPEVDPERIEQARKYAQCMRDNGYPDFPDPRDDGGIAIEGDKLDPEDPKFKAADEKCRDAYLPNSKGGPGGGSRKRSDA